MTEDIRRPLKVRGSKIVNVFSKFLSRKNISPNSISITSIFFALLAAICFILFSIYNIAWLFLLSAAFIQGRLLCNLFDGLVAIEGGKSTKSGELFNDIPDRISDPLILISAAYAIQSIPYAIEMGWLAGLLSIMTAYIRTLNVSIGAPTDFRGPMAKQHRMAVLTMACISAVIETYIWSSQYSILVGLLLIILGCLITSFNRAIHAYKFLEK
jgi:phosphatidylglycerophosphate synthase